MMEKRLKVGDHVTWNSESGHVSGKITKVHTKKEVDYKRIYPSRESRLSTI
jgi:hypothetical protein